MSQKRRSGGRRGLRAPAATAALVALLVAGIGGPVVGIVFSPWGSNADSGANASDTPSSTPSGSSSPDFETARSVATKLDIPAMHVRTNLERLGTNLNKTMENPGQQRAGWFTGSVTPGELGVSIISGYIRGSSGKPGAFVRLGKLDKGDAVKVRRADGDQAVYKVTDIKSYAQDQFPVNKVFARESSASLLRLVTVGGSLRPSDPRGSVVVYARLSTIR